MFAEQWKRVTITLFVFQQERARAAAILVLQAGLRGMRCRIALSKSLREKFEKDSSSSYTVETLELQMTRINYFFNPGNTQMLAELGRHMLLHQKELIRNMLTHDCTLLRLRLIIEKCFKIFSEPGPTGRSTVLRILEVSSLLLCFKVPVELFAFAISELTKPNTYNMKV